MKNALFCIFKLQNYIINGNIERINSNKPLADDEKALANDEKALTDIENERANGEKCRKGSDFLTSGSLLPYITISIFLYETPYSLT